MRALRKTLAAVLLCGMAGLAQAEWLMEIDVIAVVPDQA